MHHCHENRSKNKIYVPELSCYSNSVKNSLTWTKSSTDRLVSFMIASLLFSGIVDLRALYEEQERDPLPFVFLSSCGFHQWEIFCVFYFLITREPKEAGLLMDISITPSSLQMKTPEGCTEIWLPAEVRLVPSSCRGLQYVPGDGLHLWLQAQAEFGTSK